jgi:hypothetical protein
MVSTASGDSPRASARRAEVKTEPEFLYVLTCNRRKSD